VRVTVADDSSLVRAGIVHLLESAGFDVVGESSDAAGAVATADRARPDVAVLDIRMPPTHTDEGLVAAARIRATAPDVGVLVLSQYLHAHYATRLLAELPHGVGYLLKDRAADPGVLPDVVRRVAEGDTVVDPSVIARLMEDRRSPDPVAALSEREREVLAAVAEGLSNRAIARRLFITERTVEFHVTGVFQRLGLPGDDDTHRRVLSAIAYLRHVQRDA